MKIRACEPSNERVKGRHVERQVKNGQRGKRGGAGHSDANPDPPMPTRTPILCASRSGNEKGHEFVTMKYSCEDGGVKGAGACAGGVGKRESRGREREKEIMMRDEGKTGRRKEKEETSEAERQRESNKKREKKKRK